MVERRWNHFRMSRGDLVVSTSATIGMVSEIGEETEGAIPYTGIIRMRPRQDNVSAGFIKYFMQSTFFIQQAEGMAAGSVLRHYGPTHLKQMAFPLPPLAEQKAIAGILGALDEKIELNRRMNETLEAMARAIFKSWFVDFDPVRAKLDGRHPPGLDAETAALFPDSFEHCGGELIPTGWRTMPLTAVADLLSGGTPKKGNEQYWNGSLPWISPKAMGSIHVHDSDERVTDLAVGNGTRMVPQGAVLVMVRGMGLHQGVRISQAQRNVTFNQDVKALVPKFVDGTFLLFALLDASQRLFSKVQASGHGTGVLPTDALERLDFAIPPADLQVPLVEPLNQLNYKIAANSRESRSLAAIRDALLPKLLSGEIRVASAERIVGRAV